jgi:hypothetical protein
MTSEESEVTESVSEPGVGNPRRHRRRNIQNLQFKLYERNPDLCAGLCRDSSPNLPQKNSRISQVNAVELF